jgi:cytochrome P450
MSTTRPNSPEQTGTSGRKLPPEPSGSLRDLVRDPLRFFLTLTRQYGDVVRYRAAPEPAYLVNHPDDIKQVLVLNNHNYTKETYINHMFKSAVADGLLTSEGEVWRQQRRLIQPAFHRQRIANLGGLVVEETGKRIAKWAELSNKGQAIDIASEMSTLTLSITGKALFGVDLGSRAGSVGQAVDMAANLLEKPRHARFQEAFDFVDRIVYGIIEERRKSNIDTGDVLSLLLQARDEETGQGMSDQQLRDQVITLLLAGYDTTASAITWTWYLLSQNPSIADKLHAEVDRVLAGRLPEYEDLSDMPYNHMVFEEALRYYPPAWILGRKALEDDELGGYDIPAGTIIAISPYAVHRHKDFWEDPEKFDPERFSPERSDGRHHFAYLPFGAGPRQCIGNNFALMEAGLIIATIAQKYRLTLVPGQTVQPEPIFILRPPRQLMMALQE